MELEEPVAGLRPDLAGHRCIGPTRFREDRGRAAPGEGAFDTARTLAV